jgi:hypothetical protein
MTAKSQKPEGINFERWAAVAGIVTLPITIVSVFVAWLALKGEWDVASLSGAFDKPLLTLGIGQVRLSQLRTTEMVLGEPKEAHVGDVTIASIPFSLANEGEKSVDYAALTLRFPAFMKRQALKDMNLQTIGPKSIVSVHNTISSDDRFDYSTYIADLLNPKIGIFTNEPMYFKETNMDIDAPFKTKDGVSGVASLHMFYSVECLATISGRDISATNYNLKIGFMYAESLSDMVPVVEKYYITSQLKNTRDNLSFWQYLSGLIFAQSQDKVILVYNKNFDNHEIDGKILRVATGTPEEKIVYFNLLSWRYLFQK